MHANIFVDCSKEKLILTKSEKEQLFLLLTDTAYLYQGLSLKKFFFNSRQT